MAIFDPNSVRVLSVLRSLSGCRLVTRRDAPVVGMMR